MNRANLLPTDLRRRSRRRLWRDKFTCAIAASVCIAAAWSALAVVQIGSLDQQLQEAESVAAQLRSEQQEMASLEATCDRMQAEIESIERLRAPIPMTGVLALLSTSAPETITFDKLVIECARHRSATASQLTNRGAAPVPGESIRVHVTGAAASDASVVSYIGQLSGDRRIRNVRSAPGMTSARDQQQQQQGPEHSFAIIFELVEPGLAAGPDGKGAS